MQVAKWGNSLAVRLPASVVEALQLTEGDDIEIIVDGPRQFAVRRSVEAEALMARLDAFRGRLPAGFRFDRDEANGDVAGEVISDESAPVVRPDATA